MIFPIVFIYYILHSFCIENENFAIRCGYLCEGSIKNHQIPLNNVYCRLESLAHENESLESQFLDVTQNNDLTSYNCIIFDDNKKFWWENYGDFVFYPTFILENDDVCLKVSYPFTTKNQSELETSPLIMYELCVLKLSFKFFKLAINFKYRNENFMKLKESFEIRSNSKSTSYDLKRIKSDEIQGKTIFEQQLDLLEELFKEGSADKKNLSKNLEKFYSVERIKCLISNNQTINKIGDMNKTFMSMIKDSLEFFQQKEYFNINNLENDFFRLSFNWSKVIIFELNMVEIINYNTTVDLENFDIQPSDLIFKNENEKIMKVTSAFILITRGVEPNYIHNIVNRNILTNFKVKYFSIEKYGISKTINWNDLMKTENKNP